MTYVIRYRGTDAMLYEMPARMAERAQAGHHDSRGVTIKIIDGTRAHRWVRDGLPHATGLWIDSDGRIRKSRPSD